jgi:hypothetical protein|tara:strand:- start:7983 stop:8438 length:456 start_codon:yes stop_codon:yes gene_type:complete
LAINAALPVRGAWADAEGSGGDDVVTEDFTEVTVAVLTGAAVSFTGVLIFVPFVSPVAGADLFKMTYPIAIGAAKGTSTTADASSRSATSINGNASNGERPTAPLTCAHIVAIFASLIVPRVCLCQTTRSFTFPGHEFEQIQMMLTCVYVV